MMQNSVSLLQMRNVYPIMKPLRLNKWKSEPILSEGRQGEHFPIYPKRVPYLLE